jgi:hypothetical protein
MTFDAFARLTTLSVSTDTSTQTNYIKTVIAISQGGVSDHDETGRSPRTMYANANLEWLDAFAYACKIVNNPIINITSLWKPYLPDWYLKALPASVSSAPSPLSGNNSSLPTPTSSSASSPLPYLPSQPPPTLSKGAKAGISVGGACLLGGLLVLLIAFLRARKKSKQQTRQVAVLHDQMNDQGMSQRINTIINGEDSGSNTPRVVLPNVPPNNENERMSQATTRVTQTPYPPVPPKNESFSRASTRVSMPPLLLGQREMIPSGQSGYRDSGLVYPPSGYESRPGSEWVEEYDAESIFRPRPLNVARRDGGKDVYR